MYLWSWSITTSTGCCPNATEQRRNWVLWSTFHDDSARPPNLTSVSCDLDVWPQSWSFHPTAPWTSWANLQQNIFILLIVFKISNSYKIGNKRTVENIMPPPRRRPKQFIISFGRSRNQAVTEQWLNKDRNRIGYGTETLWRWVSAATETESMLKWLIYQCILYLQTATDSNNSK